MRKLFELFRKRVLRSKQEQGLTFEKEMARTNCPFYGFEMLAHGAVADGKGNSCGIGPYGCSMEGKQEYPDWRTCPVFFQTVASNLTEEQLETAARQAFRYLTLVPDGLKPFKRGLYPTVSFDAWFNYINAPQTPRRTRKPSQAAC